MIKAHLTEAKAHELIKKGNLFFSIFKLFINISVKYWFVNTEDLSLTDARPNRANQIEIVSADISKAPPI